LAWCLLLALWPVLAQAVARPGLSFGPSDSNAAFSVRLVWFQTVSGHFREMRGGVRIDPADGMAHVQARIRVDSVKVHPAHYRKRLLGPHFFDAPRYPFIHFVSDPVSVADLRNGAHLKGHLTLHGVTRPLTLQLSDTRCPGAGLKGCTLHLLGWLDRTRYDMHAYRALVSRRVRLNLVIRLVTDAPQAPATARSSDSR
jgi:polyisoprenoid-binding protein YceI